MAEKINLDKVSFLKDKFKKVVDTDFNFFAQRSEEAKFTIGDFFQLYEQIFEFIPKEGDIESHRYILNKEAEYLGVKIKDETEFQLLLDEITKLRRELLDASNTILELKQ